MLTSAVVLVLLSLVGQSSAQQSCFCDGQYVPGTWTPCTSNVGFGQTCHLAVRTNYGLCRTLTRGQIYCHKSEHCLDLATCTFFWSSWVDVGTCGKHCIQESRRSCILNDSTNLTLSDRCTGGGGLKVQVKRRTCTGGLCISTTSTASTTTTHPILRAVTLSAITSSTKFLTTKKPTVGSSLLTTTTHDPNKETTTPTIKVSSSSLGLTTTTGQGVGVGGESSGSFAIAQEIVILIAVLGSVAMLCVAIVAIACLVSKRKSKSNFTLHHNNQHSPSLASLGVPPIPPYETAVQGRPRAVVPTATEPMGMVSNRLYETIEINRELPEIPPTEKVELQMTSDGYLRPLTPPQIPESVYVSSEENPNPQPQSTPM